MNQTYTVFSEHGFQNTDYDGWRGLTLEQTIDRAANELGMKLIAWAPEGVLGYEGKKNPPTLRAESIAAGRLIEKVGDKYVARGMEEAFCERLAEDAADDMDVLLDAMDAGAAKLMGERQRPRLTWADAKPFDKFKGAFDDWTCSSGTSSTTHTHSHPLQKMAEGKEGFGSAALLKKD